MFVKPAVLKKLMKRQYKTSGLVVANNGPTIYIGGDWWGIETLREFIPNQIKAAIIELTGEFPEEGEVFNATKDGNQMQMDVNNRVIVETDPDKMRITSILINSSNGKRMRILQDEEKRIVLIDEEFISMVDNTMINAEEGETSAEGPFYKNNKINWENNVSRMAVGTIRVSGDMEDMVRSMADIRLV